MKIKLLTIGTIAIIMAMSCSNNTNQETTNSTDSKKNNDTTISGNITKMWWSTYQGKGQGGITMDNGKELTISTDYLGANNSGRIFINSEVSDILFLDKENDKDRLNTKYLNKNAKVTFDKKTSQISKIELTGGESVVSQDTILLKGYISGMTSDKYTGLKFITLKDEQAKETKIRIFLDEGGHYRLSSIYGGEGRKSDYVFSIDNYQIVLTPNNTERKVVVKTANKLVVERMAASATTTDRVTVLKENVILDIVWDGNSNIVANE